MLENLLIKKCKTGDGEAFRQLMKIYRLKLYSYLWRFSSTKDENEELMQETLIKVWKGFKKYDEQKKFPSWLFSIAHNVAMDSLRKTKSKKILINVEEVENNLFNSEPDESLIQKETIRRINSLVETLSEKQKKVFLLRQHGELTFNEISKTTGEPLNTVLSHMRYAVKKIKKQLEKENESRTSSVA